MTTVHTDREKENSSANAKAESSPCGRRRQRRHNWTATEERVLIRAVQLYGEGHWNEILQDVQFSNDLRLRNNVGLKDKWRNIKREMLRRSGTFSATTKEIQSAKATDLRTEIKHCPRRLPSESKFTKAMECGMGGIAVESSDKQKEPDPATFFLQRYKEATSPGLSQHEVHCGVSLQRHLQELHSINEDLALVSKNLFPLSRTLERYRSLENDLSNMLHHSFNVDMYTGEGTCRQSDAENLNNTRKKYLMRANDDEQLDMGSCENTIVNASFVKTLPRSIPQVRQKGNPPPGESPEHNPPASLPEEDGGLLRRRNVANGGTLSTPSCDSRRVHHKDWTHSRTLSGQKRRRGKRERSPLPAAASAYRRHTSFDSVSSATQ